MYQISDDRSWSPYIAGALSGIVFILSVWFAGKFVGASTTFVRSAGMVERLFSAERVAKMDYFVKEVPKLTGSGCSSWVSSSDPSLRQPLRALFDGRPCRICGRRVLAQAE